MGDRYKNILENAENDEFIKKLANDAKAILDGNVSSVQCEDIVKHVSLYDLYLEYEQQGGPGPCFDYEGGYEQFVKDALAEKNMRG